jgi:hypothetical protein
VDLFATDGDQAAFAKMTLDRRQAGLVARQPFFGAGIAVRPKAAALEQSVDSLGDQSHHFHHCGVFGHGQLMEFGLTIGSGRVNPIDNDAVKVRGES